MELSSRRAFNGQPVSGFLFLKRREAEEQRETQREISLALSAPPNLCVSKKNPLTGHAFAE